MKRRRHISWRQGAADVSARNHTHIKVEQQTAVYETMTHIKVEQQTAVHEMMTSYLGDRNLETCSTRAPTPSRPPRLAPAPRGPGAWVHECSGGGQRGQKRQRGRLGCLTKTHKNTKTHAACGDTWFVCEVHNNHARASETCRLAASVVLCRRTKQQLPRTLV